MALGDDVRALSSLSAFRDLDPEAVRLIAFSAETRILRAGQVLFRLGEPAEAGYVLLSGQLFLVGGSRDRPVLVRAPALLGENALVADVSRAATATVVEPASVLKVSRALYRRILTEYPEAAARIRHAAATRLFDMRAELEGLRQTLIAV